MLNISSGRIAPEFVWDPMSGIAGIFHLNGKPVDIRLVQQMTSAMAYRGADGIRHWNGGSVAFGQCRTHTTPESLVEVLPFSNASKTVTIVLDGRVDNALELRTALRSERICVQSNSDSELILRVYERWGPNGFSRIDGDFSYSLWDSVNRVLFCVRDRTGNRPYYYWSRESTFTFASDIHAIQALPDSPRTINAGFIAEHLAVSTTSLTDTLFLGIQRVPPASYLTVSDKGVKVTNYWSIDTSRTLRYRDKREYVDHFLWLFKETLSSHMRAIGPVGFHLSGGVDSSSVLCTAVGLTYDMSQIESYSLTFPGQECDESHYIREVVNKCNVTSIAVEYERPAFDDYAELVWRFRDLGVGPNGAISKPLRKMAQSRNVRVMLTGYGSDEIFGKSPLYYSELIRDLKALTLFTQLRYDFTQHRSVSGLMRDVVYRGISPCLPAWVRSSGRAARELLSSPQHTRAWQGPELVRPDLADRVSLKERLRGNVDYRKWQSRSRQNRFDLISLGWNVRGQEMENREIELYGMEERNPFQDRRIIEFALSLPEEQISADNGKYILREAMTGILPESVRLRRDKADFSFVVADALLDPAIKRLAKCEHLTKHDLVDGEYISSIYTTFETLLSQNSADYVYYIWQLWMTTSLEMWLAMSDQHDNATTNG